MNNKIKRINNLKILGCTSDRNSTKNIFKFDN